MSKKQYSLLSDTSNNQIISSQDKNLAYSSYVSPITPEDEKLLHKAVQQFRPNTINYEDSWGYIIQATRHNGFKWYDKITGSLVFFGRKSDTDPSLAVPNFFATPLYLSKVVETIQHALEAPKTILKNVKKDDLPLLKPYGFREYKKNEQWAPDARFDDQTYPQLIIDLNQAIKAEGKKYHHLRKALRKNPHAFIRKYQKKDYDAVLALLALKDGNSPTSVRRIKGMYFSSHAMYPSAHLDKFVIISESRKEIIGFTALSPITPQVSAFVALIFKPGVRIESVWGIYQTLGIIHEHGTRLVNVGGCEYKGTDIFMRRTFQPVDSVEKVHLVFDTKPIS